LAFKREVPVGNCPLESLTKLRITDFKLLLKELMAGGIFMPASLPTPEAHLGRAIIAGLRREKFESQGEGKKGKKGKGKREKGTISISERI
jgi:hypothetical protein